MVPNICSRRGTVKKSGITPAVFFTLLSYDELKDQVGITTADLFKQADADSDGSLDHDEWARSREQFGFGSRKGGLR